jgi:tetratricopeptide (TPR) repeat protein
MHSRGYLAITCLLTLPIFAYAAIPGAAPAPANKPPVWIEVQTPHFTVTSDDGEKTAHRIAEQFEEIRYLYSRSLKKDPRVDPPFPIIIFAMKNEDSLSQIIPEYWAEKGHLHPDGIFEAGQESNFIALRANAEGEFAYQTIYHEYVHLIVNLNSQNLPTWLNEGFAEFYSSAKILGNTGEFGDPSTWQLDILAHEKWLPLDVLFKVDHKSPYYNEADKANVFYAESWALVDFLILDPDMQKAGLLGKYQLLVEGGADPLAAGQTAFGDLTKLRNELQSYVSSNKYSHFVVPMQFDKDSITYDVRKVPPAEAEARLAAFDLDRGQYDAARAKIQDAVRLDPKLAAPAETMGMLLYRQHMPEEADKYFARAMSLGSKNALTYFYHGVLTLAQSRSENSQSEAQAAFEKAVALDPDLHMAWANLANLYVRHEETADQAVHAATEAVNLSPGTIGYEYDLGMAYARARRYEDARKVIATLRASSDPASKSFADQLTITVAGAEKYASAQVAAQEVQVARHAPEQNAIADQTETPVVHRREDLNDPAGGAKTDTAASAVPQSVNSTTLYSMSGTISAVNCNSAPEVLLTLKSLGIVMRLHGADAEKLTTQAPGARSPLKGPICTSLGGKNARIGYRLTSGKQWDGEIQSIELRDGS